MIIYINTYVILHTYPISENHKPSAEKIIAFCAMSVPTIAVAVLVIWRVFKHYKQGAGNITS